MVELIGLYSTFAVQPLKGFVEYCTDVIFAVQTNKCSDSFDFYGLAYVDVSKDEGRSC